MGKVLKYTGKALENGKKDLDLEPYIASPGLVRAVNIALFLKKRPLLLMGEPGVGKTRLAESVAYELLGDGEKMKKYFFKWSIKSTTKAKDGLYRYDTFKRLSDSQILRTEEERKQLTNLKLGDKYSYIQRGILGEAFTKSTKEQISIILIDEIDKADIDFANDLLNELENYEFTIPETGEEVKKATDFEYPLIIITSNRERELPPAFLRRCLYYYINFPDDDTLENIINKVFGQTIESTLVKKALKAFNDARAVIADTEKKPSTSELIDWFAVLNHFQTIRSSGDIAKLSDEERSVVQSLELLDNSKIPYAEVLLKTYESYISNVQSG